jgi:hypothetical protein
VFFLNLPVGGVAPALVVVFLKVNYDRESIAAEKLKQIDSVGNTIFVASVVAILMARTYGGTIYLWSSWKANFPLASSRIEPLQPHSPLLL